MIALITGIVGLISTVASWYLSAANVRKRAAAQRKAENDELRKAVLAGDIDRINALLGLQN